MTLGPVKVGFQGSQGSYSEGALLKLFSTPHLNQTPSTMPFETFQLLFESLSQGNVEYALVPIENSISGTFHKIYDYIHSHSLHIVGEYKYHEKHCLIALQDANEKDIQQIISQNYVIDQCHDYLSQLEHVSITLGKDTSSSVALVKKGQVKSVAAIAGARAAKLHGLKVLKEGIEDDPNTMTRYFLLSKTPIQPSRHLIPCTSLFLTCKNQVGSFFKILSCFSLKDINICKIESRPSARSMNLSKPWEYVLYIDIDGSTGDQVIQRALESLKDFTESVTVLGSYPRYQPPIEHSSVFGIGM